MPLEQLRPFQKNLKKLSPDDRARMRRSIITHGFTDVVAVWLEDGVHHMLNGHQRVDVATQMVRDEGYVCPPVPVVWIDAADRSEAKRKLLVLSTAYGQIDTDGLAEFVADIDLTPDLLFEDLRLPDFSIRDFMDSHFTPDAVEAPAGPAPADTVSNTKVYNNETRALESFLSSDVRRITIYTNAVEYDQAVQRLSAIALASGVADYKAVLFYLLELYDLCHCK